LTEHESEYVIVATWPDLTMTRVPGPTSAGPLSGTKPLPSLTNTAPLGPETVAAQTVPHPYNTASSAPETERVKLCILVPHTENGLTRRKPKECA
jgi:hypothetical protein